MVFLFAYNSIDFYVNFDLCLNSRNEFHYSELNDAIVMTDDHCFVAMSISQASNR